MFPLRSGGWLCGVGVAHGCLCLARENPASAGDDGAQADETSGDARIQLRRSVRL
jgi:hypothetical protein